MAAVPVDMVDRLFDVAHDLDGHDQVQVFGRPVRIHGCLDVRASGRTRRLISPDLNSGVAKRRDQAWDKVPGHIAVDQNRLRRVAHRRVLDLGVHADAPCLVQVCPGVHIHVADAVRVAHHRDLRVVHDVLHQLVGSSWNNQVDQPVETQDLGHLLTCLQQVHPAIGNPWHPLRRLDHHGGKGAVRVEGFTPALEHDGIAGLEAEGSDLHQGVGA